MASITQDPTSMASKEARDVDVAIVGAGIAGMSLAYFLSRHGACDVALIERESRPALHASGRSARTLVELDPVAIVQRLKIRCERVVNAAGAWAAEIAALAGVHSLALVPYRRSIGICGSAPAAPGLDRWPLVWSDPDRVYFREFDGQLLMCPMDEQAAPAQDATAAPGVVEGGLDRLARLAPGLGELRVLRCWAGLRTFAPDRVPVVGDDPAVPGFFWLAGQGGCGIETSAVLGELAAELLAGARPCAFDPAPLSPARF